MTIEGTYIEGYEEGFGHGLAERTVTDEQALMDRWAHEYALDLLRDSGEVEAVADQAWAMAEAMIARRAQSRGEQ